MAYRRTALAVGEWFHCYTRTIDKSRPFEDKQNTERFLETLYLANQSSAMPIMPKLHQKYTHDEIFALKRTAPLVSIGAYCIMPTHYHLLVQPIIENGLSEFMHKVGTGFVRFYNDKYKRVGNLFVKPFRSKHVSSDGYFCRVASYIHLNPVELFEPKWKEGRVRDKNAIEKKLKNYALSSLGAYENKRWPQMSILNIGAITTVKENMPTLRSCIDEALEYYQFLELDA